jgi:hypothetical protein
MKKTVLVIFGIIFIISCSSSGNNETPNDLPNNGNNNSANQEWLIPINEVKDGGPGKDGIASIDAPKFEAAEFQTHVQNDDLVVGVIHNGEAKAYPHAILDWHEIVNDETVTINYCPLTGSAFGWKNIVNGSSSTFGVSGLLYNTNLILYDRKTDSNWSQILLQCVNGDLIGDSPEIVNVIETNWLTWKSMYPFSSVLSRESGSFDLEHYDRYPYGNYLENHNFFLFNVTPLNSRLPHKQRVFAIINNDKAKVYQFSDFEGGNAIVDSFNGKNYLVVGNENIINAFELTDDISHLSYEYCFDYTETFFKDNEGNNWSIFGKATSGSREGQNLITPKSLVSFWFAIAAFYPDPDIYSE